MLNAYYIDYVFNTTVTLTDTLWWIFASWVILSITQRLTNDLFANKVEQIVLSRPRAAWLAVYPWGVAMMLTHLVYGQDDVWEAAYERVLNQYEEVKVVGQAAPSARPARKAA